MIISPWDSEKSDKALGYGEREHGLPWNRVGAQRQSGKERKGKSVVGDAASPGL